MRFSKRHGYGSRSSAVNDWLTRDSSKYAQAFARYIQCEEATSSYGLLGKHPTTGGVITSPFVAMSQQYQKNANLIWYEIYDVVKQNCTSDYEGGNPNDMMEQLLRRKG